jgi:hypothetical protein
LDRGTKLRGHISAIMSLVLSAFGGGLVVIGSVGRSPAGLPGYAYPRQVEANYEAGIATLFFGLPFTVVGILIGLYCWRSLVGKTAVALPAVTWLGLYLAGWHIC